jgi:hypothetical protein
MMIPGKSFTISSDSRIFQLSFHDNLENNSVSSINALSVKTGFHKGRKVLYINPGGSYKPSPASHYSGISEQFCFSISAAHR